MAGKKRRHQPKSASRGGSRRGRGRSARGPGQAASSGGGGVMQGMVRGLRAVAGVEASRGKKKPSLLGNILWVVLVAALAAWAYTRYLR